MASPRNRRSNKDIEKSVYLTEDLEQRAKKAMFELDVSFSHLVRDALEHYIEYQLSLQKQSNHSGKVPANNGQPNGLFTAEQVIELFEKLKNK